MEKLKAQNRISFNKDIVDRENHSIAVILSDETEVVRYSWSEGKYFLTLKHGEANVDLSRKDILNVFVMHNDNNIPVGIFEDVRLEDGKLKARAVFDPSDETSMFYFNKLANGFLKSFSVGININKRELTKEDGDLKFYDVTSWEINEASIVWIPAIPGAKVGLEKDDENSGENRNQALAKNQNLTQGNVMTEQELQALNDKHAEALTGTASDATKLEKDRCSGIMALGGNAEFTAKAISDNTTVGDAAIALLKANDKVVLEKKTDFEEASKEVVELNESETTDENLSSEQKLEKVANKALDEHFEGSK